MDRERAFSYTAPCYSGEPASCTYACPFRLDLRSFLKKAAKGRWGPAYKELRTAVLFPSVTAALCPAPCQDACQWKTVLGGNAIEVRLLEQACLDNTAKKEPPAYALPDKEGRIAVVGAGPAGLSGALLLAQKRFSVTVFEREAGWGGQLRAHPRFEEFDADFALGFSVAPARFLFGRDITSLDELTDFDAVLIATGKEGGHFELLEDWDIVLSSTKDPRIFLCGEVTGHALMEGMAQAATAARAMEAFLQTGSPAFAEDSWDASLCARYTPHPGQEIIPGVLAAGDAYTEEEAKAEAARCMQCDCEACMKACELLIQYKKKPPRIGSDAFLDGGGRNSVSKAAITRQTWSCNLCGRCGSQCHVGADLRGLFQYSRADRVAGGNYPPALHDYWLRDMAFHAGEAALAAPPEDGPRGYAFFPGCALGASKPAYVHASYAWLREKNNAGLLLNCCGAPAWWAGDGPGFEAHTADLRAAWEGMGGPTLVTACATCERMLEASLPDIPLLSLYELLVKNPPAGSVSPFGKAATERCALFDPCAASGRDAEREAVRALAEAAGVALTDYDSDGQCCGHGGHIQLANPRLYDEVTANRAADSPDPYVTWCANCREVFASKGKQSAHILDIVFGLEPGDVPHLEQRRENSLAVKKKLMETYLGETFEPEARPWDELSLEADTELLAKMERQLITLSDAKEAIWRARQAGEGFKNADGDVLVRLIRPNVTYWALYREASGGRALLDAYTHRMRIRERSEADG